MTTLEDDLRETLRNGDRVVPPGFADHILRRVRRQQTRRRRAAAGVAVLALLGGAAGLAGGWVGGASFVSLVPAESNECGGVSVRALGAGTSGGGTRNLAVLLTNTSEDVCRVSPDLTVALLVGERRLDVAQLAPVRDRGLVDLSGGEAALSIELVWDNWCLGQVRAARVHLSLPGGSGLTTEPFQPSPTCRDNEAPSTVRVFQLGLGDVATAPSAPLSRSNQVTGSAQPSDTGRHWRIGSPVSRSRASRRRVRTSTSPCPSPPALLG